MLAAVLVALIGAAVVAYVYRDKLAAILPGWKHAIAAISSFVYGIASYLQGQPIGDLFKDHRTATAVAIGVGLLVLVLSWVTPRKDA